MPWMQFESLSNAHFRARGERKVVLGNLHGQPLVLFLDAAPLPRSPKETKALRQGRGEQFSPTWASPNMNLSDNTCNECLDAAGITANFPGLTGGRHELL